jgi:hypothetical protein
MEDGARRILEEDADALALHVADLLGAVVVLGLLGERDAVVDVEVGVRRRVPREAPPHPLPVRGELRVGRERDGDHRDVARLQVDDVRVEVVGPERAALAAGVPARIEHEVVDDELAAAGEELRQRASSVRPLEDVLLLDALPRQVTSLAPQLVPQPRELLLLREQLLPLGQPLVVLHHAHHDLQS